MIDCPIRSAAQTSVQPYWLVWARSSDMLPASSPDAVIEFIKIWRVWQPLVFTDKIRSVSGQPLLRPPRRVNQRTILLKYSHVEANVDSPAEIMEADLKVYF